LQRLSKRQYDSVLDDTIEDMGLTMVVWASIDANTRKSFTSFTSYLSSFLTFSDVGLDRVNHAFSNDNRTYLSKHVHYHNKRKYDAFAFAFAVIRWQPSKRAVVRLTFSRCKSFDKSVELKFPN